MSTKPGAGHEAVDPKKLGLSYRYESTKLLVASLDEDEVMIGTERVRIQKRIRRVPEFKILENFSMEGGDLTYSHGGRLPECQERCDLNEQCKAFVCDKWNQFCFLKRSVGPKRKDPKYVYGVRQNAANAADPPDYHTSETVEYYRKKKFKEAPGAGRGFIEGLTLEECEAACRNGEQNCAAFTYEVTT